MAQQYPQVRDYSGIIDRITALPSSLYDITQHGALTIDPNRYPLFSVSTKFNVNKPTIFLSALNHGHEINGGEALIRLFECQNTLPDLFDTFNVVAIPYINLWGYEHDTRRNSNAIDINRDFGDAAPETEEAAFVQDVINDLKARNDNVVAFCDMHETYTIKDTAFRQETAELDGTPLNQTPVATQSHIMIANDNHHRNIGKTMIEEMLEYGADIIGNGKQVVASGSKNGLVISQSDVTLRAFCQRSFVGAACFSSEIVPKDENNIDEQAVTEFYAMLSGMVKAIAPTNSLNN